MLFEIRQSVSITSTVCWVQIRPASKAEAVGLQEGDLLVAVNGVRSRGLTHNTTTALMDLHPHVLTVHVLRSAAVTIGDSYSSVAGQEVQ